MSSLQHLEASKCIMLKAVRDIKVNPKATENEVTTLARRVQSMEAKTLSFRNLYDSVNNVKKTTETVFASVHLLNLETHVFESTMQCSNLFS